MEGSSITQGQSQRCCGRWMARAQAGALLAKLLQTLIYTCCCLSLHKGAQRRWVMSGFS